MCTRSGVSGRLLRLGRHMRSLTRAPEPNDEPGVFTESPIPPLIRDRQTLIELVESADEELHKLGLVRRTTSRSVFVLVVTLLGTVMVLPIYEDWDSHGRDTTGGRPALLVIGILITAPVAWCVAWLARYAAWRAFERRVQRSRLELTLLKTELQAVIRSAHI